MVRRRVVITSIVVPVLVVGVVLAGGFWLSSRAADPRPSLAAGLDSLPADTQAAGFTDWALIRKHLDLGSASTRAARASLNDDATLRDLTTRSIIGRSVEEMHNSFGWSAADLDWEAYGQAADGSAMVARLDQSVSLEKVRAALRRLGYVLHGQVWSLEGAAPNDVSNDLLAAFGAVAVVSSQHLVVAADRSTYVSTVLQVIDRKQPSLLSVRRAADVAASLVGSDSALLQTGATACAATSLNGESADVRAQGRAAVVRAGDLSKVDFAGRGLFDESEKQQSLRFAMSFDSPARAAEQLPVREMLTMGPFIGREGRIEDSLRLTASTTEGSTAVLSFDHPSGTVAYMAGDGPLLFASCPA